VDATRDRAYGGFTGTARHAGPTNRRIVEVARKIASRIIEQASRIRVALTSCCPEAELLSLLALGLQMIWTMKHRARVSPKSASSTPNASTDSLI
jgi:hypothetical protein